MKQIILLFLALIIVACSKQTYTNKKYFNHNQSSDFKADTDRKQLINLILNRAVVNQKNIPDYQSIKNKNKIYIENISYSKFYGGTEMPKITPINPNEIPNKINDVQFCVKSQSELQAIANKTNDFLYLTLGNIEINGTTAKIGISNNWILSKKNKEKYIIMSGGGYVLTFKKINKKWEFYEVISHFQS